MIKMELVPTPGVVIITKGKDHVGEQQKKPSHF